jgi:tRNA A-37 threonylcarbamoyl transferase component Bud32
MPDVRSAASIDDLARAVLDASPVDWQTVKAVAAAADAPALRGLEALASLMTGCGFGARQFASAAEIPAARTAWGILRIVQPLGRGSYGDVYRAIDPTLDREVALKVLRRAARDATAAKAEGQRLARVHHPHVVTVYGADVQDDRYGLWMELLPGPTLATHVLGAGPLAPGEAVAIARDLAGAVEAVHRAGLLHRDIKAQNAIRAADGRFVLTDFGTGRPQEQTDESDYVGTPVYAAPEVLADRTASVQSDIYSLGVLLYYLLTASYPVTGATVAAIGDAQQSGRRVPLTARRRVDRQLAAIVDRATDPRPERRFQTAADLESALSAWLRAHDRRHQLVRTVKAGGAPLVDGLLQLPAVPRAAALLVAVAFIVLLSGLATYLLTDYLNGRQTFLNALLLESRTLLQATEPAVASRDTAAARAAVSGLALTRGHTLRLACLFDGDRRLFLEQHGGPIVTAAAISVPCPPDAPPEGVVWRDRQVRFAMKSVSRDQAHQQYFLLHLDEPAGLASRRATALTLFAGLFATLALATTAVAAWLLARLRIRTSQRA